MHVRARVVSIVGDSLAEVILHNDQCCKQCHGGDSSCRPVKVKKNIDVQVGDEVEVVVRSMPMFLSTLLVFWTPIVVASLGVYLFRNLSTTWMIIYSTIMFLLSLIVVFFIGRKFKDGYGMTIRNKIKSAENGQNLC